MSAPPAARVISVIYMDNGKSFKVKGAVLPDGEHTFEIVDEIPYTVDINSRADIAVLEDKEWYEWSDQTKPLLPGTHLFFHTQLEYCYNYKSTYRYGEARNYWGLGDRFKGIGGAITGAVSRVIGAKVDANVNVNIGVSGSVSASQHRESNRLPYIQAKERFRPLSLQDPLLPPNILQASWADRTNLSVRLSTNLARHLSSVRTNPLATASYLTVQTTKRHHNITYFVNTFRAPNWTPTDTFDSIDSSSTNNHPR